MNTRRDEDWLDGELRRAVDTGKPEFDAETWKRRYAEAYDALTSRDREPRGVGITAGCRKHWLWGTLAAAAVVVISMAALFTRTPSQRGPEQGGDTTMKTSSSANVVSMMALRSAYQRGGEEALNQQLDKAMEMLGPRPDGLLTLQILLDRNG